MMRDRWEGTWQNLNVFTGPQDVLKELICLYSAPDRSYHNLTHIENCLTVFEQTKHLAVRPEEVELAIWFHDAVYDPTRADNEQRSAEWAGSVINRFGLGNGMAERVQRLILATRDHTTVDRDAQLLVDVDLSILGATREIFWQYEANIRKEYAWVPEELFRQKRVEILRSFLDRQCIYYLEEYRQRFEAIARSNLKQSIAQLLC